MQVGSSFIRAQRREPADPSAPFGKRIPGLLIVTVPQHLDLRQGCKGPDYTLSGNENPPKVNLTGEFGKLYSLPSLSNPITKLGSDSNKINNPLVWTSKTKLFTIGGERVKLTIWDTEVAAPSQTFDT